MRKTGHLMIFSVRFNKVVLLQTNDTVIGNA